MKRPTNFNKINHKIFWEDAIGYFIVESNSGLWIMPTDQFKSQFKNAILLDMMWGYPQQNSRAVQVKFCRFGTGTQAKTTTSETIKHIDLKTMTNFVDWCRMLVVRYQKQMKE